MSKQVETRDRFKITAEVESETLGPLLAQLARMGLQNMNYELITDVVRFRSSGGRVDGVSAAAAIRAWMVDHPAFAVSQLIQHFEATGRTAVSARQSVRTLVDNGELIRLEKGHYRRVDAQLAPPAAATPPAEKKRTRVDGPRVVRDVNNWDFIADIIKGRKQVTMPQIQKAFVDDGRNPHSASPIVSSFCKQKLMKGLGDGTYAVLKSAAKSKPTPSPEKKEKDRLRAQARRDRAKLNDAGAAQ